MLHEKVIELKELSGDKKGLEDSIKRSQKEKLWLDELINKLDEILFWGSK